MRTDITVIIPVYNTKEYLEQCLNSVVHQTLKSIQIICIDDGSTDGSYEILLRYAQEYENIVLLRQENQGAGIARNQGIQKATGEYICFLDADDFYYDDSVLEMLYYTAVKNKALICGGNIVAFKGGMPEKYILPVFETEQNWLYRDFQDYYYYQRFIFSRKLLENNQIVFPSYRRFQDPPFMLKAMLAAKCFYAIEEPVYVYRTGHKEVKPRLEVAIELLTGVRECFLLAKENDLRLLYDRRLKGVLDAQLAYCIKFIFERNEKVCALFDQINEINRQWLGGSAEELTTKEKVWREIDEALHVREELLTTCKSYKEIIVYGAGKVGSFFLKNYAKECENIIGIAVSQKPQDTDELAGYEVKGIEDYMMLRESALVVVAVGIKNKEEIIDRLIELGFKYYICVDYQKLLKVRGIE